MTTKKKAIAVAAVVAVLVLICSGLCRRRCGQCGFRAGRGHACGRRSQQDGLQSDAPDVADEKQSPGPSVPAA